MKSVPSPKKAAVKLKAKCMLTLSIQVQSKFKDIIQLEPEF